MMRWMGAAMATALLVSGCARVEGEKFVGHWVNVQTQDETMDIERSGKQGSEHIFLRYPHWLLPQSSFTSLTSPTSPARHPRRQLN